MEALANFTLTSTRKFYDEISAIVAAAEAKVDQYEWADETDKKDYMESVSKVKKHLLECKEK